MAVVPYKDQKEGKKTQVAQMFNNISKKYDFLNRLLSMGIDIYWRKQAVKILKAAKPKLVLDIATGTGDFAIEALNAKPQKVIGVDISEGMLAVGKEKVRKKGLEDRIEMQLGDSEKLLFEDNKFDAVIVAFGVRNFENLSKGLSDMRRVLKPGGQVIVVEFSQPEVFPFRQIYNFYFSHILPRIGNLVSKDDAAYTYLPESVKAFPYGEQFLAELRNVGFKETRCKKLTFGICSIYVGTK
ncbi:MAG: bifunctional demethylmenaquinone methyltransferase/2-methoxy-6-polyprenyl-1,4-benzoquinol methylase UbiE [Cytophagales bacterium]|nr:bifunctional demethylmenaquinone methyltransferase/2-methoxy-6-polyprenyl-1,4-benzoquinol methylase UbiE [Cytophagales bacterium]